VVPGTSLEVERFTPACVVEIGDIHASMCGGDVMKDGYNSLKNCEIGMCYPTPEQRDLLGVKVDPAL
jgi:hypothetical protein